MKIVIPSKGKDLTDLIDDRFGRCAYFIIYDTDTNSFEARENEFATSGGAGIKAAQFVINNGDVLIGANVGPNAYETLSAGNIKIVNGVVGKSVKENIDMFLKNELKDVDSPTVEGDHNH